MEDDFFLKQLDKTLSQIDNDNYLLEVQKKTKSLLKNRSIILFGAGALGRSVITKLTALGKKTVAFCDNNPKLWGAKIDGMTVLSPDDAVALYRETGVFVATIYTSNPLLKQLADLDLCFLSFPELAMCYPELLPHCALDLPQKLVGENEAIKKCLNIWSDQESKREYIGQIKWRLTLDRNALSAHAPVKEIYFALDLFDLHDQEVMIDAGAYTGDSIQKFLKQTHNSFKKIIAIEADSQSTEKLQQVLTKFDSSRTKIVNKVIGAKNGSVKFNQLGSVSSTVSDSGIELECTTLDTLIGDDIPTYIKMDIEGAELDALKGARKTIAKHYPILAICLYHHIDDLWKIPNYLHSIAPEYKFFLRRYSDECWEQVCYAVPTNRSKK